MSKKAERTTIDYAALVLRHMQENKVEDGTLDSKICGDIESDYGLTEIDGYEREDLLTAIGEYDDRHLALTENVDSE